MDEARLGYPEHMYLACGHLAEAESELLSEYQSISEAIRQHRMEWMDDPEYSFNIGEYILLLMDEKGKKDEESGKIEKDI